MNNLKFKCPLKVFLVGMMGIGKTTVGKSLSTKLGLQFYDTDIELERRLNISIADLIEQKSILGFRQAEQAALIRLILEIDDSSAGWVITTGGGLPCYNGLIEWLRHIAPIIYLKGAPETILKNLSHTQRPLLDKAINKSVLVREILNYRIAVYEQADFEVNVDGKSVDIITNEIINLFKI